jgi:CRISPR-associated protein Cmr4
MSLTRLYWLHCLSPTHAGVGRGVGYIDLPIDRDVVTGWPILRSSGLKGVWADYFGATERQREKDPLLRAAFGVTGTGDHDATSGSLIPTDARLVCLPVRSFRGTFAWTTSPLCLQWLRRTLELAGVRQLPAAPTHLEETRAHHAEGSALVEGQKIYLEDLDFDAYPCPTANAWAAKISAWVFKDDAAWTQEFQKRFVVLPDVAFDYLCQTATEVHTRVRIDDETKTVAEGALWTEESLPAETILMGLIQCQRVFGKDGSAEAISPQQLLDRFATQPLSLQIGGKATVGRGQVRCIFSEAT